MSQSYYYYYFPINVISKWPSLFLLDVYHQYQYHNILLSSAVALLCIDLKSPLREKQKFFHTHHIYSRVREINATNSEGFSDAQAKDYGINKCAPLADCLTIIYLPKLNRGPHAVTGGGYLHTVQW